MNVMKSMFFFLFSIINLEINAYIEEDDALRLKSEFEKWKNFGDSGSDKKNEDEIQYSLSARKSVNDRDVKNDIDINELERKIGILKDAEEDY